MDTRPLTLKDAGDDPSRLPGWHPLHMCGMFCDGQDGLTSSCYKEKRGGPPSEFVLDSDDEIKAQVREIWKKHSEPTLDMVRITEAAMKLSDEFVKSGVQPSWLTTIGTGGQSIVIFFNKKPPTELLDNFPSVYNGVPVEWRFMSQPVAGPAYHAKQCNNR